MNPESLNLSNIIKPSVGFEAKKVAMSELLKKATIAVRSHWSWCCTLLGVWKMFLLCKRKNARVDMAMARRSCPRRFQDLSRNPDLIILISCTELFVLRIFWCIVIYWYALTIDIYRLAVVCVCVSILFGMSYVFFLAPFCSWCRTSSSNSRTKTCLVFSLMRKTLSDFLLVQDIWVTRVTDFSLNMDKPDGHWCVVALCLQVNSLDELQRWCWWSQGAASTSKKEGESSQKGADSSHALVLLLWHQRLWRYDSGLVSKGVKRPWSCFGMLWHHPLLSCYILFSCCLWIWMPGPMQWYHWRQINRHLPSVTWSSEEK